MHEIEKKDLSVEELEMEQVELIPDRELLGSRRKGNFNLQANDQFVILGQANNQQFNFQV